MDLINIEFNAVLHEEGQYSRGKFDPHILVKKV